MTEENVNILEEILEQILAGYWDWDIETGDEYMSPTLKKMFGYEDHELSNRAESWQKIIFEEDLKGVLEKYDKHVESKGAVPYYNEVRYRHKNGSTVWVICTGKVIEWGADGKPKRMIGCHINITDLKKLQQNVVGSEEKLRYIVENAFEGISIASIEGKVLYESPGVSRMLGYSADDRKKMGAFDNVHPDDMREAQEAFGRALMSPGETFRKVLRTRHKDGSWRWVECAGRNLADVPSIGGLLINYRDITGLKNAEEERLRLAQHMEKAQRLESLGILAGGIAHDFNNLLGGIYGSIDLARTLSSQPEVRENLELTFKTMHRARSLTRQLLTFAKGGSPERKPGRLNSLIKDTAEFALAGASISPDVSIATDLWQCNYDSAQIAQVIENMVINAQQAMPAGGKLSVIAENAVCDEFPCGQLDPGRYVRITIKDTGIGIPEDIIDRIFDPFFTTKQKGSGLGLSASYSVVRKHEGCIAVESAPGKGSTFCIYLPASGDSLAEQQSELHSVHRGSGRILIMDDADAVRKAMSAILRYNGYEVLAVADGSKAVELFDEHVKKGLPFVAAILDLTVQEGMGGREALAEIRKRDENIPVFVASGYSEDPVINNPKQYGFAGGLTKPFTSAELLGMVSKHIGKT